MDRIRLRRPAVFSSSFVVFLAALSSAAWAQIDNNPPAGQQALDATSWCVVIVTPNPAVHLAAPGVGGALPALPALPAGYAAAAGGAAPGGAARFRITKYDAVMLAHTVGGADFRLEYSDGAAGAKPAGLRWLQVVDTNKPLVGDPNPTLDPRPDNRDTDASQPPYPFYLDELPAGDPGGWSDADFSNTDPAAGAGAVDYRFTDVPKRSCWSTDGDGRLMSMHAHWSADLRLVTWDRNRADGPAVGAPEAGAACQNTIDDDVDGTVNDGCTSTVTLHDGIRWGFKLWPREHRRVEEQGLPRGGGNRLFPVPATFDASTQSVSITPGVLSEIVYLDGTDGSGDPALGAEILVEGVRVLLIEDVRDNGRGPVAGTVVDPHAVIHDAWSFQGGQLAILQDDEPVLLARLEDTFLHGVEGDPEHDSEFQARLTDVFVDHTLGSRYLAEIEALLASSPDAFYLWAFRSGLLQETDDLTVPGSSSGFHRMFSSIEQCGNGQVDPGEDCDSLAGCPAGLFCDPGCFCTACGNGQLDSGEACDAPGLQDVCSDGQECSGDCTACVPICGNGLLNPGEECDDGNTEDGDCCSSVCTIEPDGAVCDDGNQCSVDDACFGGECIADVSCDDGDACTVDTCDPAVGCAHSPVRAPDEVNSISVGLQPDSISWSALPEALFYEVARGDLDGLPVGPAGGDEVCFGGRSGTGTFDPSVPSRGRGFWYDVRAVHDCGAGPFGVATNGPRVTATCGDAGHRNRDEIDAGDDPFVGGCHYNYSDAVCSAGQTLYATDFCDETDPTLLVEWTDSTCHPLTPPADTTVHDCHAQCIARGFVSGSCTYGLDPPCPPGVPTARCRCF